MRTSNYDKTPYTSVGGTITVGWEKVINHLNDILDTDSLLVVECYQGVHLKELREAFASIADCRFADTAGLFRTEEEIRQLTQRYITDDRIFGYMCPFGYQDLFDMSKVEECRKALRSAGGRIVLFGHGASFVAERHDILVYADMPRWEIQMRFRRKEVTALGVDNSQEEPSKQYKRGYFLDWNICDNLKKTLIERADFWLDTTIAGRPKMITGQQLREGLYNTAHRPFRVVPFFDPAPWGGQWMKRVCGLNPDKENYGWCFDCVPEENSLLLKVEDELMEIPSNNVVFYQTRALLGGPVEARFGQSFPIRFDFLDTFDGGNLSLQVHPTTQYIRDTFGMNYTQDESYYLLDAEKGATVYLGLKRGVNKDEMIAALEEADSNGTSFDAERFVNCWPANKHDHFLIPGGTVHCSGKGALVLEISATPSIFTFKLWDWGRLGLDGRPRPINIGHGKHVIQWERDTDFVEQELKNHIEIIAYGDGWCEERTGLHENEFIETRRHWFTKPVTHSTDGGVQVLNLVEGEEAIVESTDGNFEPFVVHYAETFIIPACVGTYTIRPFGKSAGQQCATIKAYVRCRS